MKTKFAISKAGGIRALAAMLGITTSAVYAWGKTVPKLRQFQLKEMHPEWFK